MTALSGFSSLMSSQVALDIPQQWVRIITFTGTLVVVSCAIKLVRGIKAIGYLPGFRIPFAPISALGGGIPVSWWNPGFTFVWKWRKHRSVYNRFGCDSVSFVPFLHGSPAIFTRSQEVARQILSGGIDAFDKSPAFEGFFTYWGPNVVEAHGDQWRKHRRISGPAFNNDTFATVWDTSRKLFAEMMSAEDGDSKDVIDVPSVKLAMFKFSLTIFASVGFGAPLTWSKPPGQGDELSVHECLDMITKSLTFSMIAPSWAWKLPHPWIQRTRRAYDTMRVFVRSQVNMIREAIRSEASWVVRPRKDLLSLLIHASEDIGGKRGLSDDELVADVFTFLYAGYETTALGLAATLALLALDFDLQDEIASQAREVTEARGDGTLHYEDYGKLDKVLAAFYEAIRLFPPAPIIPREAQKDIVLNISDTNEPRTLFVKKGSHLVVDLIGLHYSPRCYADPEVYRPSRWYAKTRGRNSNAKDVAGDFTVFSLGPRSCMGRKFATAEAVCFLAHLLRDWRIEPLFLVRSNGQVENVDEWRERVLQGDMLMTLGIKDHGIRLVRRK